MDEALPYLLRGMRAVTTESSVLVSSSKYLNHPRLRDWVASCTLRRSGHDRPATADTHELNLILREIQDYDRIDELFERERATNPVLDAWLGERFISTFRAADLGGHAPDTLGGTFLREVVQKGYSIDIVPPPAEVPSSHMQFFMIRNGQTHDFEHLLCGGGLDFIGELVPYWARLVNLFRHLGPELAGELCVFSLFGQMRLMSRGLLHYPQVWMTLVETMERGIRVGRESGPIFMMKCEDALHLPMDEARAALGVRGAAFVDTSAATAIYEERA